MEDKRIQACGRTGKMTERTRPTFLPQMYFQLVFLVEYLVLNISFIQFYGKRRLVGMEKKHRRKKKE